MKLAGLSEVGLCCEVMADDGTMMRLKSTTKTCTKHAINYDFDTAVAGLQKAKCSRINQSDND